MELFHNKTLEIAEVLGAIPGIELVPNPPHTNMLHIHLRGSKERLEQASEEIIRERSFFLFGGVYPTPLPGWQTFELTVRKPACELETAEIGEVFTDLMRRAGG
jgi:hypothetical protein